MATAGAFGYNLSDSVTIVMETTESKIATTDAAAFDILRQVVKHMLPGSPINF